MSINISEGKAALQKAYTTFSSDFKFGDHTRMNDSYANALKGAMSKCVGGFKTHESSKQCDSSFGKAFDMASKVKSYTLDILSEGPSKGGLSVK